MKKNSKEEIIKKSILFNTIGSFTYLLCQWIITYVILWLCDYKDVGIFSLAMSLSNTFYSISIFGMRGYQATDLNNEHTEKTYLYSRFITILLAVICSLIYTIVKGYNPYSFACINIYLLFKVSEAIVDLIHGTLQKKWLFKNIGISLILRGIISLSSFLIFTIIFKNILISIIAMAVLTNLFVVLYDVKVYKKNVSNFGKTSYQQLKELLLLCTPLAIYSTISNYAAALPRVEIASIYSEDVLGIYSSYANIAIMVQVAASFLITPLSTYFAELFKENNLEKFKKTMIKIVLIIIAIGVIAITGSTLFGKTIFKALFGGEIISHYYLMNQMIIISLLTSIMWLLAGIIVIFRKFYFLIIANIVYYLEIKIFSTLALNSLELSGINYLIMIGIITVIILYIIEIIIVLKKRYKNV